MTTISRVWIDDGCIACSLCQDYCPEVFLVVDGEDCIVKDDAGAYFGEKKEDIHEAATDCPVEVIRIEVVEVATA